MYIIEVLSEHLPGSRLVDYDLKIVKVRSRCFFCVLCLSLLLS